MRRAQRMVAHRSRVLSSSSVLHGPHGRVPQLNAHPPVRNRHHHPRLRSKVAGYHVIALDALQSGDPIGVTVLQSVALHLEDWLKPLRTRCFELETDHRAGFELLQTGQNIGIVCLARFPVSKLTGTTPVTGGTGGLRRLFTRYLRTTQPATTVVLLSRSGTAVLPDDPMVVSEQCDVDYSGRGDR